MQRKLFFRLFSGLLAALLLALGLVAPLASAPLESAPPAFSLTPQQAAAAQVDSSPLSATADILRTVSRLRELSIIEPVKSGFKTHDEIEESVIKDLNENSTPEEFESSAKMLTKLGLLPPGFQLRDYVVKLLKEQIAGYYEPKTKVFYLAAWLPLSEQKTVMAHELTHALQDQHFNLRRFEKWPKGDSDAELAAHSVVEGEATIVMIEYNLDQSGTGMAITRLPPLTERMLQDEQDTDAAKYPVLAAAPAVLRENLAFPYIYGAGFVQEVLKQRSWQTLDGCYQHLPSSSAQIMHPEKFLAGEDPVKIQIGPLESALGSGWKRADQDVNGEFGYLMALEQFINKGRATQAVSGWAGDRYALYENKQSGAEVLAQYTTWENPEAAREFFDAYSVRTRLRYKDATPGRAEPGEVVYKTHEGMAFISIRDKDVVMVEGASTPEQLKAVVGLLWKSTKTPAHTSQ